MDRYAVIMAGGGGTRFWPLSRQSRPKQLLNLTGNDILINECIKRLSGIVHNDNILVVTNKKQYYAVMELITGGIPLKNILTEPVGRNTSACAAYAAITIGSRCEDAVMCVFPSDHFITDEEKFKSALLKACDAAEKTDKLVTIGIKPVFPSTGYGYIKYNPDKDTGYMEACYAEEFVEKPVLEKARVFVDNGNYLWNSGIFIWKVSTLMDNLRRFLPRIYSKMVRIREYIGTDREQEVIDSVYSGLDSISIDFGIMERSDKVLVVPGNFGWNDVGSWESLGSIFPTDQDGNIVRARHVGINTKNSVIYSSDRLIATIGLEDIIIADTGDALLVCPKRMAQEVKSIVEYIKKEGMDEFI